MKRILLSFSVAALLAIAGGSFAQGYSIDNSTAPAGQNASPQDPNNTPDPNSPNMTSPNSQSPGLGTVMVEAPNMSSRVSGLGLMIMLNHGNGVPLSASGTTVSVPPGETVKTIEIGTPNGKTINCRINKTRLGGVKESNAAINKIKVVRIDTKEINGATEVKSCIIDVVLGAPGQTAPGAM